MTTAYLSRLSYEASTAVWNTYGTMNRLRAGADVHAAFLLLRATAESKLIALMSELRKRELRGQAERVRALLIRSISKRFEMFACGALLPNELMTLKKALDVAADVFAVDVVSDTIPSPPPDMEVAGG